MKYLVIAALLGLVSILVYSRVRPYLKLIQKVAGSFDANGNRATGQRAGPSSQLVRCASCETWVPTNRAITLKAGTTSYCSKECLESPVKRNQKLAG